MKLLILALALGATLASATDYGYLKPSDQKYYKNDSMEGKNSLERIDNNVKEINKLHGEIAALKAELQALKTDVEGLKKGK